MENAHNFIDITYKGDGSSTTTDTLGMREMQQMAYEHRNQKYLLIKAPPASGKSRALMYIALDKLRHQGIKRVVVAVPEKSIGRSFKSTELMSGGFFADWKVKDGLNLTDVTQNEQDKANRFRAFFKNPVQEGYDILVCAHATLRNGMKLIDDTDLNNCLLAIDEFHHTSADAESGLGEIVRRCMNQTTAHIVAMTGSYFRGDGVPVLRAEDEARFWTVTYNYYQQLNGYKYLKNLQLGYHFYHGRYPDHLAEVLDTTKKTIIHIPSVNSRASTGQKYQEVEDIINHIGTKLTRDYQTNIITVKTADGRTLKVADLVEDTQNERNKVQGFLQNVKGRDDVDIIIALGTAKEGFDWPWCEVCLTIGVRGSLTEVVQIIGRCTRDCEGKTTAKFINMIAMPDATQPEVKVAVNDFLKAITASLLMEQVLAPSWNFKTVADTDNNPKDKNVPTIVVEGLKPLSTVRTQQIVNQKLDDLKAAILNNPQVVNAIAGTSTAEHITLNIVPKIIHEQYPDLSESEVEEVRQRVLLDTLTKGAQLVDKDGNPIEITAPAGTDDNNGTVTEGSRFLKLTNRFVDIDKLNINLINSINPFQRAYEVLSKTVDAPTLKVIQDTIEEQKIGLTIEEAIKLFKGPVRQYVEEHNGQKPSIKDPNPQVRELAAALQMLQNQKVRHMMGLDYDINAK